MSEFRTVTPAFAVAGQMSAEDFAQAAKQGFRTVICNRPDNEAPGQLSAAEGEAAAKAAGLDFYALPFAGPPPPAVVSATAELLEAAAGPVLAYCRSGTRSVTAWALASALNGTKTPDQIIALAGDAGYDVNGARGALERLKPGA